MKLTIIETEDGHEKIEIRHNTTSKTVTFFRSVYCPYGEMKSKDSCFTLSEEQLNRIIRPLFVVYENTCDIYNDF